MLGQVGFVAGPLHLLPASRSASSNCVCSASWTSRATCRLKGGDHLQQQGGYGLVDLGAGNVLADRPRMLAFFVSAGVGRFRAILVVAVADGDRFSAPPAQD